MSATRQLPCAFCGKPIEMSLAMFFPGRWGQWIPCPACGRSCLLPKGPVLIGLIAFCLIAAIGCWILKASGLMEADTIPSILAYLLLLAGFGFIAGYFACRICRYQVERLVQR